VLDDPESVLMYLRQMGHAGHQAHSAAGEDEGLTGALRDLIFGLNTMVDAVVQQIEDGLYG
jgi:hypothetical protein